MKNFEAKPYKLVGKVQNYAWGTKNEEAFIPHFLGVSPEKDLPYAEYWIGVHPKAPSDVLVDNAQVSLAELLKEFPVDILGERVAKKFDNTLPFLLKVLSINQALSIQSHPNKVLAKILHKKNPTNYPDDNHKPEIAIALDNLVALVGIKNKSSLKLLLETNCEIKSLLSEKTLEELSKTNLNDNLIRQIYSEIMYVGEDKLKKCIQSIIDRLKKQTKLSKNEEQFLVQSDFYKNDVGLLSILLFNLVTLKEDEAIFTPAGIPHAYIKGNIIECMANSDNVVRAGLTQKYKDVETLIDMLELDNSQSVVDIYEQQDRINYKTQAEEFRIEKLKPSRVNIENNNDFHVLIVINGNMNIIYNSGKIEYKKGDACLIPASLTNYSIIIDSDSQVFKVSVP